MVYHRLAARFRRGDPLSRPDLDRLLALAERHGNHLLVERVQDAIWERS
jgi:hypothetical protein